MFGIQSARQFFEKARADYERVESDIANPGLALNCTLSLYHLHEWVWARWLKERHDVQAALGIRRDKEEFVAWLDAHCPHFALLKELANGSKHCRPVHSTQHVQGYGRGPYGVGPYGSPYLLIDLGEEHPPAERYLVTSAVLKEIMSFWTGFFAEHGINHDPGGGGHEPRQ